MTKFPGRGNRWHQGLEQERTESIQQKGRKSLVSGTWENPVKRVKVEAAGMRGLLLASPSGPRQELHPEGNGKLWKFREGKGVTPVLQGGRERLNQKGNKAHVSAPVAGGPGLSVPAARGSLKVPLSMTLGS